MAATKKSLPTWPAFLLMVLGCGMMLYGFLYPNGDGGRSTWTVEKAKQRQEASLAMHDAMTQAAGTPTPEHRRELREATDQYEKLEAERAAAIEQAKWFSSVVRWVGTVLACLGAVVYFVVRH